MKAAIVSYHGHNNILQNIKVFFENNNVAVSTYLSDFAHKKGYLKQEERIKDAIYIHSPAYEKNISFARISAYLKWSKLALKEMCKFEPDIIFLILPPNSLLKQMIKHKSKNPKTKVIAYIMDLWPDSLPISAKKERLFKPILNIWKGYRNNYIDKVDFVFSECDYYKQVLASQGIDTGKFETLYLFGDDARKDIEYVTSNDLRFLYLGSINNIIDIDKIVDFLSEVNKHRRTVLNIIGAGEQKDKLVNSAREKGITVEYHGEIYDDAFKQNVMNNCDFGLNVYKDNIKVGLTIKSIDYMRGGLPIINTIKGDTFKIVENEKIGYNLDKHDELINEIINTDNVHLRKNVTALYNKNFTKQNFFDKLQIINNIAEK